MTKLKSTFSGSC